MSAASTIIEGGFFKKYLSVLTDSRARNLFIKAYCRGYKLPSIPNARLINSLFVGLKAAITSGNFDTVYADINVYATDVNHGSVMPANLGFDGMKWNNPAVSVYRVNTVAKTLKKGYSTNGVDSFIISNYRPSDETITTATDFAFTIATIDEVRREIGSCRTGTSIAGQHTYFDLTYATFIQALFKNGAALGVVTAVNATGLDTYTMKGQAANVRFYKGTTQIQSSASPQASKSTAVINDLTADNGISSGLMPATKFAMRLFYKESCVDLALLNTAITNYLTAVQAL